jgi:hypothetical protein
VNGQPRSPSRAEQQRIFAIKTWRYLRLAMIALVIGLAASVTYEAVHRGSDCVQTSISAYYYTHAQAIFVAALVAIGTCLVCLRGSTDIEDVMLNVAGMLAPVVALVPTPFAGACATLPGIPGHQTPNIENNITALLVVGVVALVAHAALSWRRRQSIMVRVGYGVALAVWVAGGYVFVEERPWFVANAHDAAAYTMFGLIILVAWINALSFKRKQDDPNASNRYSWIAFAMLSVFVLVLFGGKYHVLLAEIDAIVLFAVFWAIQTEELWGEGLRWESGDASVAVSPAAPRASGR